MSDETDAARGGHAWPPATGAVPPAARTALRGLIVFAATYLSGALGFALPHFGARLALPLLPSGIAVAALTRWGRGLWPAVFLAEVAIDLGNGTHPVTALAVGCGLPAGAWLTAWMLERRRFDPSFAHHADVPLFVVAAVAGMSVSATVGILAFRFSPTPAHTGLLDWVRWWSNTSAGVLIVAPLLIAVRRESFAATRRQPIESLAYLLVLGAILLSVLSLPPEGVPSQIVRPPLFVVSLVLIVVGAIRFGLVVAAGSALVLIIGAAWAVAFDRGAFRALELLPGLIMLWSFTGALTGVGLLTTALLAQRDAAAAERLRAERRYAQVFEASPQPLWVHDAATLTFLLVNAATERQYGYRREELLAMRVTDLAARGEAPLRSAAAGTNEGEPFETRHVSRDGRVLEIELWSRAIDFGGRSAVLVFATDATERKALGRALIDAIAGEQRRIGQEMHDGLGQELTGLSLSVRALANRAGRERLPFAAELDHLATLTSDCIRSARRIVHGLSPLAGADGNLVAALSGLAEAGTVDGVEVRVHTRLEAPLTLALEARGHLYRIAQEALQNAQKHAEATRIDIEFTVRESAVRLAVVDDGKGPPGAGPEHGGLGMRTMRYRTAAIGGRLSIGARSPSGTALCCDVPQPAAAPAQAGEVA